MPKEPPEGAFECMACHLVWLGSQLKPVTYLSGMTIWVCRQEGSAVRDITETERGKRFLEAKRREEGSDADQI